MKKAIINKLIATASAMALSVPVLLANPVTANASVSSNVPVSGNVVSQAGEAGTSDSAVAETKAGNEVIVGAKRLVSTVKGVYTAKGVNGVAIKTSEADVATAAGLNAADLAAGTKVKFYVCDSRNKEAKKALASYAAENGKNVVAYINADLYKITKKGVVTAVKTTNSPVEMVFGVPGRLAKDGNSFSVVTFDADGKAVVMNDVDTDAKTITINTNNFGVYAIVY